MPLSCSCPGEYSDAPWFWYEPEDYGVMPARKRRARCCSCRELIDPGTVVNVFARVRPARSKVEIQIYGEDDDAIDLPPLYQCERCADLFWSLTELGFCACPEESMVDLAKEYAESRAP